MPDARHHHQAHTPVDPGVVWNRLQEPALWADVAGVDRTFEHRFEGNDLSGFRFASRIAGMNYQGQARVTEAKPGETMTLEIRSREMSGEILVTLTPNSGTDLAVTMTMRPVGLMGTMVFAVANTAVASGFADKVDRLAAEMA